MDGHLSARPLTRRKIADHKKAISWGLAAAASAGALAYVSPQLLILTLVAVPTLLGLRWLLLPPHRFLNEFRRAYRANRVERADALLAAAAADGPLTLHPKWRIKSAERTIQRLAPVLDRTVLDDSVQLSFSERPVLSPYTAVTRRTPEPEALKDLRRLWGPPPESRNPES